MTDTDTLKNAAAQKVFEFINQYGLWGWVFIALILVAIGYLLDKLVNFQKTRSEKKKIISEAEKIAVETAERKLIHLEKLLVYKKIYVSSVECLGISLRSTIEQVGNKNIKLFDQYREEALNIFYNNFIPTLLDYFNAYRTSYSKEDIFDFVVTDVFHFLETSFNFLEGVNIDFLLQQLDKTPAKIKKTTLKILLRNVQSTIPVYKFSYRKKFRKLQKNLNKYLE